MRGKGGEVGVFAGFNPRGAGEADGELVFFHEFCGDTGSPFIVVSPAGDGSYFGGEGRKRSAFALIEPARDVGVCRESMRNAGEQGGLFSAERVAFGREKGFLIPTEKTCGGAEEGQVFAAGAEFFVGLRKRGHEGIMKQDDTSWNVFL
jgi:hypothetical protein